MNDGVATEVNGMSVVSFWFIIATTNVMSTLVWWTIADFPLTFTNSEMTAQSFAVVL